MEQASLKCAVVDGSVMAHVRYGSKPSLNDLTLVLQECHSRFQLVDVVVDASLRYQIDDQKGLDQLIRDGVLTQAPAGVEADLLILEHAQRTGAIIVSNDNFRNHRERFPCIQEEGRVWGAALIGQCVYLLPRRMRKLEAAQGNAARPTDEIESEAAS